MSSTKTTFHLSDGRPARRHFTRSCASGGSKRTRGSTPSSVASSPSSDSAWTTARCLVPLGDEVSVVAGESGSVVRLERTSEPFSAMPSLRTSRTAPTPQYVLTTRID